MVVSAASHQMRAHFPFRYADWIELPMANVVSTDCGSSFQRRHQFLAHRSVLLARRRLVQFGHGRAARGALVHDHQLAFAARTALERTGEFATSCGGGIVRWPSSTQAGSKPVAA